MSNDYPKKLGRYLIVDLLGRGGMGIVYRACHEDTGEPAAIKTVMPVETQQAAGIRREIIALKNLNHPGIIKILEEGMDGGTPWYAMELLHGTSMRTFISTTLWDGQIFDTYSGTSDPEWWLNTPDNSSDSEGRVDQKTDSDGEKISVLELSQPRTGILVPEAAGGHLQQAVMMIRRLCQPLAYMHGLGMVHQDLKPENIIIRPDGMPVLVDFGLVSNFSGFFNREKPGIDSSGMGTWIYMAPEQMRGEPVDARADLYSLGCILYEMISGCAPFSENEEDLKSIYHAKMNRDYASLESLVSFVPVELSHLIDRLLQPDPVERIGYAHDVDLSLKKFHPEDPWSESLPEALPYLYRTKFRGREEPFRILDGFLARTLAGQFRMVFIGGKTGSGKSRLIMELARHVQRYGFKVLQIQAMSLCKSRNSIVSCKANHVDEKPVLLLLDDIQEAGKDVIDFIEQVAADEEIKDQSVMMVVTGRTDVPNDSIDRVAQLPGMFRIELDQLPDEIMCSLVFDMLAIRFESPQFTKYLVNISAGNPYFLAEFLQVAVRQGYLLRDRNGVWNLLDHQDFNEPGVRQELLPIPGALERLILNRLTGLPPKILNLAQEAAVAGSSVAMDLLLRMSALEESRFYELVRYLVTEEIMVEIQSGCLNFVHDAMRQVLYKMINPHLRKNMHWRTALFLEMEPDSDSPDVKASIAGHYEFAGKLHDARKSFLEAAETALRNGRIDLSAVVYSRYFKLIDQPDSDNIARRIHYAENVLRHLGSTEESLLQLNLALEQAHQISNRHLEIQAMTGLMHEYSILGDEDNADLLGRKALQYGRELDDRIQYGRILYALCERAIHRGFFDEASRLLALSMNNNRSFSDKQLESKTLILQSDVDMASGRLVESASSLDLAEQLVEQLRNPELECEIHYRQAILNVRQCKLSSAGKCVDAAWIKMNDCGSKLMKLRLLRIRSEILLMENSFEKSLQIFRDAWSSAAEIFNPAEKQSLIDLHLCILLSLGRLNDALTICSAPSHPNQPAGMKSPQTARVFSIQEGLLRMINPESELPFRPSDSPLDFPEISSIANWNLLPLFHPSILNHTNRIDEVRSYMKQSVKYYQTLPWKIPLIVWNLLMAHIERMSESSTGRIMYFILEAQDIARRLRALPFLIRAICEEGIVSALGGRMNPALMDQIELLIDRHPNLPDDLFSTRLKQLKIYAQK